MRDDDDEAEWLPEAEAARRLGTTTNAIRHKRRRGQIPAELRDGRWHILVPNGQGQAEDGRVATAGQAAGEGADVELYRQQIELKDAEIARLHEIVLELTRRIPQAPPTGQVYELAPGESRASRGPFRRFWQRLFA